MLALGFLLGVALMAIWLAGWDICAGLRNLFRGRVQARLGGHNPVVTSDAEAQAGEEEFMPSLSPTGTEGMVSVCLEEEEPQARVRYSLFLFLSFFSIYLPASFASVGALSCRTASLLSY